MYSSILRIKDLSVGSVFFASVKMCLLKQAELGTEGIVFPYADLEEKDAKQEIKLFGIKTSMTYDEDYTICMNALNGDIFAVYEDVLIEKVIGSVPCAIDIKEVKGNGL